MVDPPRYTDDAGVESERESPPGTSGWVKVLGIIILVVIVVFLVLMAVRGPGGRHGPGRHTSSGVVAGLSVSMTPAQDITYAPAIPWPARELVTITVVWGLVTITAQKRNMPAWAASSTPEDLVSN